MSRYKTVFCIIPRRLARYNHDTSIKSIQANEPNMEFIGWVWLQRVNLVKNYSHGWVCILGSKQPIMHCPTCKQELPENFKG